MKKYIIILFSFFFFSCDMWDDRVMVVNSTNRSLIVCENSWVSDTSVYMENKKDIDNFYFSERQIPANTFKRFITNGNWKLSFENDTLVFLVYDKEAILKKRIEKPKDNYDIEKIIYLSKGYIEKNDWKVVIDSNNKNRIIKY
jgi:hypothetical protein